MQTPTNNIVDKAIERLDAEEAGVVDDLKNPKGDEDDKPKDTPKDAPKDADADKPEPGKDDKKPKDAEPPKPKYDKDGMLIKEPEEDKKVEEKKEGEFTADDAVEIEAPKPNEPQTPTDNAGIQLSPEEQKHIADNIGQPIVIRGMQGDKEVEIKAYSPNDIPTDFKFANDQQLAAATTGFQQLETKANQLLGNFRQNQSQAATQDFEQRENEGIRADVADLQKEGRFPKFTVRPGDAGFDDSPEAQQMAEVLNVMTERNEMYFKQYQQGRPYKHIGFSEAYDIWERNSPKKAEEDKKNADQDKEDEDRHKRGAERSDSNRGMNPSNIVKPTVKAGTTTRDILNRIDNDDF